MSPAGAVGVRFAPALLLAIACIAVAAAAAPAAPAVQPAAARFTATPFETATVDGLIVRLGGAAPHAPARGDADAARWRRLLADAALTGASGRREPVRRPVGRDQHALDFGQPLAVDEADRIAARLRAMPGVDWVATNRRERRLSLPTDPMVAQQWWLKPVGGSDGNAIADRLRGVPGFVAAWQSGIAGARGTAAAPVAVLDTGITVHPDLAGRILPGHDFVADPRYANDGDGRDADPADPGDWVSAAERADPHFAACGEHDSSWHGTIVSGIVAAVPDNAQGVAGVVRDGRVLPVRVAGQCGAAVADIVDAMRWAAGLPVVGAPPNPNPARIVNVSFGSAVPCGREYQDAIDEIRRVAGAVVVAAAGNSHGTPTRPATCDGVVGVVALNRDGFKTHYSNFGAALAASGIATVGGDDAGGGAWGSLLGDGGIVTVWNDGRRGPGAPGYAALHGTSFAAPQVAATMSLMLSVNPSLTASQLVDGIRLSARPHVASPLIGACSEANPGRCACTAATCGAGILDAAQALVYAVAPTGYVAPARLPESIASADVARAVALGPDRAPDPVVVVQSGGVATSGGAAAATAGPAGSGGGGAGVASTLGLLLAALALRGRRPAGPARSDAVNGLGRG